MNWTPPLVHLGNIDAAPEHNATMQALEALFLAGVKQVEVGEILEPLYRMACEWDKLLAVCEAQLSRPRGTSGSTARILPYRGAL